MPGPMESDQLGIVTGWIVLDGEHLRGADHAGHVSFRIV
jgi:hypothetical protein